MLYTEKKQLFIETNPYGNNKIDKVLEDLKTITDSLNVKLNFKDVKAILELFNENKIARLKSERKDDKGVLYWYWYMQDDFILDLISYICMKAKGKFFIYYESDDFISGYNVIVLT